MGKVKEKLQELSELIQAQLDSGVDLEDLDSYMELELNLSDYAFYLENKDTILNFFEGLKTKGKMLAEANFKRNLDPRSAMDIGEPKCLICKNVLKYPLTPPAVCRDCADREWEKQMCLNDLYAQYKTRERNIDLVNTLYEKYPKVDIEWIKRIVFDPKLNDRDLIESQNFHRGLDPKDAMQTGDVELRRKERIARKIKDKAAALKPRRKGKDAGLYFPDDLKSNYRSYEESEVSPEEVDRLAAEMIERHPHENPEYIVQYVYDWCGVDIDETMNDSFYPRLK